MFLTNQFKKRQRLLSNNNNRKSKKRKSRQTSNVNNNKTKNDSSNSPADTHYESISSLDDHDDEHDEVHWRDDSKQVDLRKRAGLEEFSSQAILQEFEAAEDDDEEEGCDDETQQQQDEENTVNQQQQHAATTTASSFRHYDRSKRPRQWMATTTAAATPHHRHHYVTTFPTSAPLHRHLILRNGRCTDKSFCAVNGTILNWNLSVCIVQCRPINCRLSWILRRQLHTHSDNSNKNDNDLVLVVHPDLLLTPTAISETVSCPRRAVLKNRLGSNGLTDKAPLLGTMRHELFEETLTTQGFSPAASQEHINAIVRRHAEDLLACGVSSREASNELNQFFPQLQRFVSDYTAFSTDKPTGGSILENHLPSQTNVKSLAQEVQAIEEPVISPQLGLKGDVDMILRASLNDGPSITTLGVELKTGHTQKTQNAHMAQLCLYILLLQTQLGKQKRLAYGAAESGVLLYMNQKDTWAVHVAPILAELKSLIGQRNMLEI